MVEARIEDSLGKKSKVVRIGLVEKKKQKKEKEKEKEKV